MADLRRRSLAEYCVMLWLRRWLFALVAGVVFTAGWIVTKDIPNLYESSATVVVFETRADETQALGAQVTSAVQQLTSRSKLEALIRSHRLYSEMEDIESAVSKFRKQIKIETKIRDYYPQSLEYLTLKYRYSNPILVQRILVDLLALLDDTNQMIRRQAAAEADRLTLEIEKVEVRLQKLAATRPGRARGETHEAGNDSKVSTAAPLAEVEALEDKEYAFEQQIAEQRRQIAEQEKIVNSLRDPGVRSNSAYGVLLARKAEAEAMVKDLASQYTAKNSKLVQARMQLEEINRQLQQLEANDKPDGSAKVASPEGRELRALQRDLARLETELQLTRREASRKKLALANLPNLGGVRGSSVETPIESQGDYDYLTKRYSWLLERQDLLERVSQAQLFRSIDSPYLPRLPVAPNRLLLILLVLASALAAGFLSVAVVELPRVGLVHDERDVQYYLGVPVVGLIPETVTPVERRLARRQMLIRRAAIGALSAASVPLLAVLLSRLRVFQILGER